MTEADRPDDDLPESRLETFVDAGADHAVFFLEGQRLVRDLALIHPITGAGFEYFRDAVLSVQPLLAFLKRGEQFGFYVDSQVPPFRLKIETAFHGDTRCALMPEGFHEFPGAVHGVARLLKLYPDNRPPYTSVIHLDGLSLGDMVNGVLRSSFQSGSVILVSRDADQSAMLHRLPPVGRHGDRDDDPVVAVERFRRSIEAPLAELFARALTGREELRAAFEALGFHPLASRPVRLRCGCSLDRMLRNLRLVADGDAGLDELFGAGRSSLEVTCDYCKTRYRVTRDDLGAPGSALH